MKKLSISKVAFCILSLQTLILFTSCERTDKDTVLSNKDAALFLITSGNMDIQSARSIPDQKIECSGDMVAQIEVSDWENSALSMGRSTVTGDEIEWRNTTELSIYITDATTDTLIARNLAMNPIDHALFENYYNIKDQDGNGTIVNSSDFFWNSDWSMKDKMPSKVNFYGFYPRPFNPYGYALNYKKNSIILQEDASGQSGQQWNLLHYAFIDQTDENMTWHDIMYSIPEKEGIRYGNQEKENGHNIQLHYEHAFSLLDIEIDKGDKYKGDCVISSMVLSGKQIFTEGTLNILNGTISPTRGSDDQEVKIARLFDPQQITQKNPFYKTMIVQPTQDGENPNDNERLILTCCIDGVNYNCTFPTLKLDAGKRYKLKLTLTPAGVVVFKIWDGATVTIGERVLEPKDSEEEITPKADEFIVGTDSNYKIVDILKNGTSIFKEGKVTYTLEKNEDSNTIYNVVTCPSGGWYATNGLQLHYDGIRNKYNGGGSQNNQIGIWYDLSGHNNDGTLRSFTTTSGWHENGLVFDGLDDIVYFSGKITPSYTMEMYICIEATQRGSYPRLVAEGNAYPSFYFYGTSTKYNGVYTETSKSHNLCFFGGGRDESLGTTITTDGETIIQLDFAYDAETKILKWYIDGVEKGTREGVANPQSIDIASIGNRYVDNTRAMAATYYSFMIYNKALTQEEITKNYNTNIKRFGSTK